MTFETKINYLPNKQGFSLEHNIDKSELNNFRKAISDQWITKIKESSTEAYKKIVDENISIQEYHLVSDYLDHSKIWTKSSRILNDDFTDWFLGVSIINMLIYFIYYIALKIKHKEKINKIFYVWILLDLAIISLSLVFFLKTSSNIFLTIEESNALNHPCVLFNYFDYHDIWHILSATG